MTKRKPKVLHKSVSYTQLVMPPDETDLEHGLIFLLNCAEKHIARLNAENILLRQQLADFDFHHTKAKWLRENGRTKEAYSDGTSCVFDHNAEGGDA